MTSSSLQLVTLLVGAVCCCAPRENPDGRQGPRDQLRSELLGCYALYTASGKLLDSTFYRSSPFVRLDSNAMGASARDTFPGIFRRLIRLDVSRRPSDPIDAPFSWWADSLSDSVRLSFSDGLSGAQVILAAPTPVTDTLFGRIEEHWDVGPTVNQRGPVRAVRLRCPDLRN
jgi:hypothetical protein